MEIAAGEIKSSAELLDKAKNLANRFGSFTWFRGLSKTTYQLVPSVFRQLRPRQYEWFLCGRWALGAPARHAKCPEPERFGEWLLMMRHYGLPTRLLDWTTSVLVAAYFAVTAHPDEPGMLWVLNPMALNKSQIDEPNVCGLEGHPAARALSHAAFGNPTIVQTDTGLSQQDPKYAMAVLPAQIDLRVLIQQSALTMHGTDRPLEDLPGADGFLEKLVIPADSKQGIRKTLEATGITESYLFPDLTHLSAGVLRTVEDDYQRQLAASPEGAIEEPSSG